MHKLLILAAEIVTQLAKITVSDIIGTYGKKLL